MSESISDPKLVALEKSLSALVPAPGRIDRDQLLFRAGQASVRPRSRLWPTSTALCAVMAAILGTAFAVQSGRSPAERIVYVPVSQRSTQTKIEPPSQADTVMVPPSNSSVLDTEDLLDRAAGYLRDRDLAVRWGLDALPPPPSISSDSEKPSLESMLGLPEKKPDHPGLFPLKF